MRHLRIALASVVLAGTTHLPAAAESVLESEAQGSAAEPTRFWPFKDDCMTLPSEDFPIIEWCEGRRSFSYTILTWSESRKYRKSKTLRRIQKVARNWLEDECRNDTLKTGSVVQQLWLAIPRSASELAQPRIGLKVDDLNVVFGNSWKESWRAGDDNLHVLGKSDYSDYSGTAASGAVPEELLFRVGDPANLEEAASFLDSHGVEIAELVSESLSIYKGTVERYSEFETTAAIEADPQMGQHLKWVEPAFRVEHVADNFLLHEQEWSLEDIPTACDN